MSYDRLSDIVNPVTICQKTALESCSSLPWRSNLLYSYTSGERRSRANYRKWSKGSCGFYKKQRMKVELGENISENV